MNEVFQEEIKKQFSIFGLDVDETKIIKFNKYYEELIETNKVMNLTAITEPKEVAIKHMVDSLSAYDPIYFKKGASLLDLGSGAGFPGIPLAIWDSSLQITLFDSLLKRLYFLKKVISLCELKGVKTLHGRAEDKAHEAAHRERYDIVTARAVARLPVLLEWALPYVKIGGYMVALKGAAYEEEIKEAKNALTLLGGIIEEVRPVVLPELSDKRAIIFIKKERKTPSPYPRKPKDIKERPL